MKWIGLTGSIATGKSTAKKLIEGLGFPVIDADEISHQITQVGEVGYRQVVTQFGNSILNGDQSLDRKSLGALVFGDSARRQELEAILHPLIKIEVEKQKVAHQNSGARACFYDVPLLFEKNLSANFDQVVLVWCEPQQQLARLMQRSQLSPDEAQARIQSQLKMCEKIRQSNFCLDNSTTIQNLEIQIHYLIKTLVG